MPVVAAADLIVELGILALFAACLLLRKAWVATLGHLLASLANTLDTFEWGFSLFGHHFGIGLHPVAEILRGLNASALELLGAGINATDYAAKRLWQWTAYLATSTARTVGGLAEWTYGELRYQASHFLPVYVATHLHPLASKVEWTIGRLVQLIEQPTRIIHQTVRVLDPRIGALEAEVATLEAAVSRHAIPWALPRVEAPHVPLGWIKAGIDEVVGQLGRFARVLTPAGIVGLVAAATLSGLELGWLKCRGVNRLGRELCGIGGLLETIFNDAIDALIVADLCQFVQALSYATREFEPVLLAFVKVENALIGCHGISAPHDLTTPALSLPPLQPAVTA